MSDSVKEIDTSAETADNKAAQKPDPRVSCIHYVMEGCQGYFMGMCDCCDLELMSGASK